MLPNMAYLVCSTPRSGSTLLCEVLKNTDRAGQPGEYFCTGAEVSWSRKRDRAINTYEEYITAVIHEHTTQNGIFGVKLMWEHFNHFLNNLKSIYQQPDMCAPDLLSMIFPNLHYIRIIRLDKVRQAVSYWRAIQTNVWRKTEEDRPLPPWKPQMKPQFDFRQIDALYHKLERDEAGWQQYFDTWGIQPLTVIYEEMVASHKSIAFQVLQYLHVSVPEHLTLAKPRLQKQADMVSEEWIERYYAIKQEQKQQKIVNIQ